MDLKLSRVMDLYLTYNFSQKGLKDLSPLGQKRRRRAVP